jgi:hypothetical protein
MPLGSSGSLSMYQLMTYTGTDDTYLFAPHPISLLDPGIKALYGNVNASQIDLLGLRGKSMSTSSSFNSGTYSVRGNGQADLWGLGVDFFQVLVTGTSSSSYSANAPKFIMKYDNTHGYWTMYGFDTQASPAGSSYYITSLTFTKLDNGPSITLSSVKYNIGNFGWEYLTVQPSGYSTVVVTPTGITGRNWDYGGGSNAFIGTGMLNYQFGGGSNASQEYWNYVPGGTSVSVYIRAIS